MLPQRRQRTRADTATAPSLFYCQIVQQDLPISIDGDGKTPKTMILLQTPDVHFPFSILLQDYPCRFALCPGESSAVEPVKRQPICQAARLCQLCGEDKAAISRALAELERRDYLHAQQVSGKKYRVPLLLTPEGKEIARQMNGQIDQWVSIGGDGLSQQERADFYRCLELIAHNLKEQVEGN